MKFQPFAIMAITEEISIDPPQPSGNSKQKTLYDQLFAAGGFVALASTNAANREILFGRIYNAMKVRRLRQKITLKRARHSKAGIGVMVTIG